MTKFHILYLADYPEHVPACAAWAYGRWGVQNKDSSLQRALDRFGEGAQKENIPLTLVATDPIKNVPVAMGSLWNSDGDQWQDKTPWIASVFTHYRYRNLGLARQIVMRLEAEAIRLGFDEVYLKSGSAAGFYEKIGYHAIDKIRTVTTLAGEETLFVKKLDRNPQ